ncbi:unnamed protein product [Dibothriocephalus latus]|uniref:Uncharacterized protein n=1 Tax=Dibothriocephalus latus TaxID=60516 RepID=A0A3P7MDB1_DIBLA|nr:unnamed protein product [Dibothriocephalus latus]
MTGRTKPDSALGVHVYQQPTAVCFDDFATAFGFVHHELQWRILILNGVPPNIVAKITAYYRSTTARVLVSNNLSEPFAIRSVVQQGCVLSFAQSIYAIDYIFGKALREEDGVELTPGRWLTDPNYTDDIAVLA